VAEFQVVHAEQLEFVERAYRPEDEPRSAARLTDALGLESSRATLWRYPPGARGRRHIEGAQEEVFVVLDGTVTLMLGEPAEAVELTTGSTARVSTGTPLQVRNQSDSPATVLIWGAPAVTGQGQLLDDLP
jgi:uncharacterized cupin superfamily protein